MNETNPHSRNNKQEKTKQEFEKISFIELTKTLYENENEEKKREIENNIKEKKLRFPNLSHLYLEISRKAANLLVEHEKNRENLENGYSNLLELISKTLEIKPIPPEKSTEQEKETQHLWKNRDLCNEAMSHYVRQIQNLRDRKHRSFTLCLSLLAIGISIFLPIILKIWFP